MNHSSPRAAGRPMAALRAAGAVLLVTLAAAAAAAAETAPAVSVSPDTQWFRDARFGLFIHWGPCAMRFSQNGFPNAELAKEDAQRFNPTEFDARKWVALARDAGMKYLVLTVNHAFNHGFALYDSKVTDFKITNTPYKRDILAELVAACRAGGLRWGFHYSAVGPVARADFTESTHAQIRELCTQYGKVDVVWFDCFGVSREKMGSDALYEMVRRLQPGALINGRGGLRGDFETPEQHVGPYNDRRPWESCFTLGQGWFGTAKGDEPIKSLKTCIDLLVQCAGGDGNLLLNVGPMATGEIAPAQAARLRELGAWLKQYGETIYGTRGGPFRPSSWGAATRKGNTLYLHVLRWPLETIVLEPIKRKITKATVLTGGTAAVKQTNEQISVTVPAAHHQALDTIVELELDGPAADVDVAGKLRSDSLTRGATAKASSLFGQDPRRYGPSTTVDDDLATFWTPEVADASPWLEIDLGEPRVFDTIVLLARSERERDLEIHYRVDDEPGSSWVPLLKGDEMRLGPKGTAREVSTFAPVKARFLRLQFAKAQGRPPTVRELLVFSSADHAARD